jgi:DNA modification methylase
MPGPYLEDGDFVLHLGDALEVVSRLPAGSVDAIVTSPPYAGQRGAPPPDEYVDWLLPYLAALARVLAPTGGFMLNLGRTYRDGSESDYIERTLLAAQGVGWVRVDSLIWRKLNAHPFVAPCYLINEHELVYWLALSSDAYRGYTAETRRPPAPETLARRARGGLRGPKNRERGGYLPAARTQFHPDGVRPGSVFESYIGREKGIEHGEPMALELAEHLVALACPPGGLVLDPFAGACTTALACRRTGRRSVCVEIRPDHCAEGARRLAQQSLLSLG